jgi:hypothetical protein
LQNRYSCGKAAAMSKIRRQENRSLGPVHLIPDMFDLPVIPRKQIPELKVKGLSNRKIAKLTGVSKDTVARELGRVDGSNEPKSGSNEPVIPGEFETIVIDPPWPMTKIERDLREVQAGFSYDRMSDQELRKFAPTVAAMAAADCHLFMWTTQRFLPLAMELTELYGFKYVLAMVWHKAGGRAILCQAAVQHRNPAQPPKFLLIRRESLTNATNALRRCPLAYVLERSGMEGQSQWQKQQKLRRQS